MPFRRIAAACALLLGAVQALAATAAAAQTAAVCTADAGALPVAAAPLLSIGSYRGPRVSANERAQRLFDQGLVFGWGFNFAEAVRSFRAAALADPDCALCRWGIAWALGPSINHDMAPADLPAALDALAQARAHAPDAASFERRLIDALALRYRSDPNVDSGRAARDYANAMRRLTHARPDDADVAVLAAEALMNAHPYDYWVSGDAPPAWTRDIVALLDRAIRLAPDHPGAHHYRIHLYEDSATPQRALPSAEKLGALAPGVGHLVHMPSHIYLRLGRYHDAVVANRAAVAADRDYLAAVQANPAYAADYALHNTHYLWAAALAGGETAVAREAADALAAAARQLPDTEARRGTRQHFEAAPWLTAVRFKRWDAVLARPVNEAADAPYRAGLVHFARGMALAATGDTAAARKESDALAAMQSASRAAGLRVKNSNSADKLLAVARSLLAAEIAFAGNDLFVATRHARTAVGAEDALSADEPPAWQIPARHALGRMLLARGHAREARDVFRADLARHPENAPALAGLAAAERQLGNSARAATLDARARTAWAHADIAFAEVQPPARATR